MAYSFYTSRKFATIFIWIFSFLCLVGIGAAGYFLVTSFSDVREIGFEIDTTNVKNEFERNETFNEKALEGIKCYVLLSNGTKVLVDYDETRTGNEGFTYDMTNYKKDVPGTYEIYVYYKDYIKQTYTVTVKPSVFSNIVFNSGEFLYDGEEKIIALSASSNTNIPEGTTVTYNNNKQINAGVYEATVTLEKQYYETLTLSATLQINKADYEMKSYILEAREFEGGDKVKVEDVLVDAETGEPVKITQLDHFITSYEANKVFNNKDLYIELKNGATALAEGDPIFSSKNTRDEDQLYVHYERNVQSEVGKYTVTVSFKGEEGVYLNNYNPVEDIVCELEISPYQAEIEWRLEDQSHDFTYNAGYHNNVISVSFKDTFGVFGEPNEYVSLDKKYSNLTTGDLDTQLLNAGEYEITPVFKEEFENHPRKNNYTFTGQDSKYKLTINKASYVGVEHVEYVPDYTRPLLAELDFPEITGVYGEIGNKKSISEVGKIEIVETEDHPYSALEYGEVEYSWLFTPNDEVNYNTDTGTITLNSLMNIYDYTKNSETNTLTLNGFKNIIKYNLYKGSAKDITIPEYIDGARFTALRDGTTGFIYQEEDYNGQIRVINVNTLTMPSGIEYYSYNFLVESPFYNALYIPTQASITINTGYDSKVVNSVLNKEIVPAYVVDGTMHELNTGEYSTFFYDESNVEVQNLNSAHHITFVWTTKHIPGTVLEEDSFVDADSYCVWNKTVSSQVGAIRKTETVELEVEEGEDPVTEDYYYIEFAKLPEQSFVIEVTDKTTGDVSVMEMNGPVMSTDVNKYVILNGGNSVKWFTDTNDQETSNYEYKVYLSEYTALADPKTVIYNSVGSIKGRELNQNGTGVASNQSAYNTKITRILAPGLKSIGQYALYRFTSLKSIDANSVTTISASAFKNVTNLVSAKFDSLISLSDSVFYNLDKLKTFEAKNLSGSIGQEAFESCNALETVYIPNAKTLSRRAFYGCNKLSTCVASNVTSLGSEVFQGCTSLSNVNFSSLKNVPAEAFRGCKSLSAVITDEIDPETGDWVDSSFPRVEVIGGYAFYDSGIKGINSSTIKELSQYTSTYEYDYYAYEQRIGDDGKPTIVQVRISRYYYNSYTFANCKDLEFVKLSNSNIKSVYGMQFENCSNLQYVELPWVSEIWDLAFYSNSKLISVKMPNIQKIHREAFKNCSSLIGSDVDVYDESGENVIKTIRKLDLSSVTEIGHGAFSNCSSLINIQIGDALTTFNSFNNSIKGTSTAFDGCTNLIRFGKTDEEFVSTTEKHNIVNYGLNSIEQIEIGQEYIIDGQVYVIEDRGEVNDLNGQYIVEDETLKRVITADPLITSDVINLTGKNYFIINNTFYMFDGANNIKQVTFSKNSKVNNTAVEYDEEYNVVFEIKTDYDSEGNPQSTTQNALFAVDLDGLEYYYVPSLNKVVKITSDASIYLNNAEYVPYTGSLENQVITEYNYDRNRHYLEIKKITYNALGESQSIENVPYKQLKTYTKHFTLDGVIYTIDQATGHLNLFLFPAGKGQKPMANDEYAFYTPSFVNGIGQNAFSESLISSINLNVPGQKFTISSFAFEKTKNLTKADFGSVQVVEKSAFAYCEKLTDIKLPATITISNLGFAHCTGLVSVELKAIESLADDAFYGCVNLVNFNTGDNIINMNGVKTGTYENGIMYEFLNVPSVQYVRASDYEAYNNEEDDEIKATYVKTYTFDSYADNNDALMPQKLYKIPTSFEGAYVAPTTYKTELDLEKLDEDGNVIYSGGSPIIESTSVVVIDIAIVGVCDSAAYGCEKLTSVSMPQVTAIENQAFYGCKALQQVSLINLKTIGHDAFAKCESLEIINMPNVESLGARAFFKCKSLKGTEIEGSYQIKFENLTEMKDNWYPDRHTWGYTEGGAFDGCTSLTMVDFPNFEGIIQSYQFYGCSSLISANIPKVTTVEEYSFQNCTALSVVPLNTTTTIKTIGQYAFASCKSLPKDLKLNSVTSLGGYAFSGCSQLTSVDFWADGLTNFSNSSFSGCTNLVAYKIKGKTESSKLNSYNVNKGILYIANGSTTSRDTLYRVPTGMKSYNSSDSTTFKVLDSTQTIASGAFSFCANIVTITAPRVKTVQGYAFEGASSLKTFEGDYVTSIPSFMFNSCNSIQTVSLKSLTVIPTNAFTHTYSHNYGDYYGTRYNSLTNLSSVTFNKIESIGAYAFFGATSLKEVVCKDDDLTSIGARAFVNCSNLIRIGETENKVILPEVDTIGDYAFYNCDKLTNIELRGITDYMKLGYRSFMNCSNQNTVIVLNRAIQSSLTQLLSRSFYDSNITADKISFR